MLLSDDEVHALYVYGRDLTLDVTEIHPMTYGQGQEYHFLGHQSKEVHILS